MIAAFKRGRGHNWGLLLKAWSFSSGRPGSPWSLRSKSRSGSAGGAATSWWHVERRPNRAEEQRRKTKPGRTFFSLSFLGILPQDLLFYWKYGSSQSSVFLKIQSVRALTIQMGIWGWLDLPRLRPVRGVAFFLPYSHSLWKVKKLLGFMKEEYTSLSHNQLFFSSSPYSLTLQFVFHIPLGTYKLLEEIKGKNIKCHGNR